MIDGGGSLECGACSSHSGGYRWLVFLVPIVVLAQVSAQTPIRFRTRPWARRRCGRGGTEGVSTASFYQWRRRLAQRRPTRSDAASRRTASSRRGVVSTSGRRASVRDGEVPSDVAGRTSAFQTVRGRAAVSAISVHLPGGARGPERVGPDVGLPQPDDPAVRVRLHGKPSPGRAGGFFGGFRRDLDGRLLLRL